VGSGVAVRSWKVRLPLYAAGLATGGAFSVLFTSGALPYVLGAALLGLLVGSAGAYRFVLLFPAAALYTLVAVYGLPPLSLSGWNGLLERAGQDFYVAAQVTYANTVPFDLYPGLLVVLLPVVVIVVAFATSTTVYEESPVISVAVLGLTIGVLSTVSFEVGIELFFALFLVFGIALLLLASDRAGRSGGLRPVAVLAGASVAALVLALPFMPFAEEAIRPASIDWTRLATGGASRLAVQADVGDYLDSGRGAELMRVRSPEPLLWRGGTLDHFDGFRWSSTVEPREDDGEEVSANVPVRGVEQRVEILEAETSLLFGGYQISNVSVRDAQERSDGSWTTARPLTEGSSYRVLSQIPQPTTEQLRAAGIAYPAVVGEKFLQLPEDRPEVLRQTAQKIQADYNPRTPYDTARAIERYLISDGGFTYNLNADYNRADKAIEEFLGGNKEGFCTQFATSMALLSRELGVPSRVVYGATRGREERPDEYVITGYNVHTWVEVYFPGVGWYPFDPTPGFSVPETMQANAPRPELPGEDLSYVSSEAPALKPQQISGVAPEPEETPAAEPTNLDEEAPVWPRYVYVLSPILLLLLLLLLLAVPLAKWALVSRGRPEAFYKDLTGRLRDLLPPGGAGAKVAGSPALTPTERLLLLAGFLGVDEGPFREFACAYSESLYAPDVSTTRPVVARAYRGALRELASLPRWRRALGAINPASLFFRVRRRFTVLRTRTRKALRAKVEGFRRKR
jgi:transglutaminase-like putative cysteine protease